MKTLRILAVDDETHMLGAIKKALEEYTVRVEDTDDVLCFDVDTTSYGEEAITRINASPPDIVLLDYKLPDVDGLTVMDNTAEAGQDMRVILITAYASIETAISATKKGAYDFLAKPFTPEELRYVVRKAAIHVMLSRRAREFEAEKRRVRFDFIRTLGHELKAPISAVSGYLYLFRDHTLGEELKNYDELVHKSLRRLEQMRKLISDLLDMTRIESGQKKRELADVDLYQTAQAAIEGVQEDARQRNITIELDAPRACTMRADQTELDMVLNNLLTNAVKYNRENGRVKVSITRKDERIVISVADTGIGMSKEEQNKLFDEFVRLKNKKARNVLGSGLGLSILRKITDLYRGDIQVESTPDEGSTFTVTLYDPGE
jgi:signal transduction histidine kinase